MISQDHRLRTKLMAVTEILKKQRTQISKFVPTSAQIFRAINPQPQFLDVGELPEEYMSADYDRWVDQALHDLAFKPHRFHQHPDNPALIDCPRERLLRIGAEAEAAGQPSELFSELMRLTDNGVNLPYVTKHAMDTAQRYLDIALTFKEFALANKARYPDYKVLKWQFRKFGIGQKKFVSESTLERALRAHGLNWSAYAVASPRKGKRNKRQIS